jgi:hypothetical protein
VVGQASEQSFPVPHRGKTVVLRNTTAKAPVTSATPGIHRGYRERRGPTAANSRQSKYITCHSDAPNVATRPRDLRYIYNLRTWFGGCCIASQKLKRSLTTTPPPPPCYYLFIPFSIHSPSSLRPHRIPASSHVYTAVYPRDTPRLSQSRLHPRVISGLLFQPTVPYRSNLNSDSPTWSPSPILYFSSPSLQPSTLVHST